MNLILVVLAGIGHSRRSSTTGSPKWGRPFFEKYGKYSCPRVLDKAEAFFDKHGNISTFTGAFARDTAVHLLPAGLPGCP